ncbi:MAG TPA: enoyl-CoA hydratase/isomerase family protein [Acidimicrobiales bacterium]
MTDSVLISSPNPGVTQLTLHRPDRLNAMNTELVQGLHDALDAITLDADCRVVVITGAGDAFCAGLDLTGYGLPPTVPPGETGTVQRSMATQQHIAALIPRLRSIRQPVIAAVNGAAAGGGLALVLGSDIRIASEQARFAVSFVKVGLSACDIGTSWLLPRIVGAGRAHELMLTGRTFGALKAAQIGLVTEVVPPDDLLDSCLTKATQIMQNSPYGIWMTKETMWASLEIPGLEAAIAIENRTQVMSLGTGDFLEAADAFLTKRAPRWAPQTGE